MFTFFVLLIVLASILMCLIVLIQNSKGGGLASGFASSNQIMGVRKTTDFLEKASEQAVEISYSDASGNSAAAPTFPAE